MGFWNFFILTAFIISKCLSTCGQLAYLPYKRRDLILDDENIDVYASIESNSEANEDAVKEEKKTRKHGLLNWLKLRVSSAVIITIIGFLLKIILSVCSSHALII